MDQGVDLGGRKSERGPQLRELAAASGTIVAIAPSGVSVPALAPVTSLVGATAGGTAAAP